jgi:outer membrane protein TolC
MPVRRSRRPSGVAWPLTILLAACLWTPAAVTASPAASVEDAGGDPTGAIDLSAAVDQALATNFGLRLARHDLAASQSSVVAERNAFDFKLTARLEDSVDLRRNSPIFTDDPATTLFRDRLTGDSRASFSLSREARWGGAFSLDTALTKFTDDSLAFDPALGRLVSVEPVHAAGTTFTYSQPLWGGFGRKVATAGLAFAETGLRGTSRSLAAAEMRLVVDVTRAFFQVVRSRAFIRIDQDAVTRARENLKTYQIRLEEGLITSIDVARAESELRQRENTAIQDEEQFRSARDRLAFLLGIPVATELEIAEVQPQLEPLDMSSEAALAEARNNRADLRNERETVVLAELAAHVARSGTKPRLDLDLSVGATTIVGNEPASWWKLDDDDTWHAGIDLSYTFGERTDDESLVQALIAEEQSKLRLEDLDRSIELEVRDAMRQILSLERRVELLRQGFELAQETQRLAQLQLQEDLIRTTDLLQIQGDVVRAETSYTDALADHAVARVTLDLVLGRYRTTGQERPSRFLRAEPSVAPDFGAVAPPPSNRGRARSRPPGGASTPMHEEVQ